MKKTLVAFLFTIFPYTSSSNDFYYSPPPCTKELMYVSPLSFNGSNEDKIKVYKYIENAQIRWCESVFHTCGQYSNPSKNKPDFEGQRSCEGYINEKVQSEIECFKYLASEAPKHKRAFEQVEASELNEYYRYTLKYDASYCTIKSQFIKEINTESNILKGW